LQTQGSGLAMSRLWDGSESVFGNYFSFDEIGFVLGRTNFMARPLGKSICQLIFLIFPGEL
jgi:hypothetical protein